MAICEVCGIRLSAERAELATCSRPCRGVWRRLERARALGDGEKLGRALDAARAIRDGKADELREQRSADLERARVTVAARSPTAEEGPAPTSGGRGARAVSLREAVTTTSTSDARQDGAPPTGGRHPMPKFKNRQDAERAKNVNIARARAIATKAENEGRTLNGQERAEIEASVTSAKAADLEVKAFDGDQTLLDGLNRAFGGRPGNSRSGRLDPGWGKAMSDYLGRFGAKELLPSGSITVPSLSAGIILSEDRPTSILNLIPFDPLSGTDTYQYMVETLRQQSASTVAPGKLKPTSIYNLETVDGRARVIATLSEPINRKDLADVALLQDYLNTSLQAAVMLALEDQVLNGNGSVTGVLDDMVGILNTPNTQVQAWEEDSLVTTRRALTVLEEINIHPTAWVMSPADWETFELLRDSNGIFLFAESNANSTGPVSTGGGRKLWGLPVAVSTAMPAGTALLGDFRGSIVIREREQVNVTWSEAGTDVDGNTGFETNTVRFRAEGRWGLGVLKPPAFVEVDLAPGS